MEEKQKSVTKAYQDAAAILRKRHDEEFHQILAELYVERGIDVKKRKSRAAKRREEIEKAKALLASINTA
jgi:hypothetical protein